MVHRKSALNLRKINPLPLFVFSAAVAGGACGGSPADVNLSTNEETLYAEMSCEYEQRVTIDRDGVPHVKLDDGKLQGKVVGNTVEFLGIPYAQPPIGALRFSPPVRVRKWTGIRDATAFGPGCPQNPAARDAPPVQSEDCLTLNVFTPKDAKKTADLPVMVYIHGGGFVTGASSMFDGQQLSEAGHVVVVDMNYRLGALGFWAHPELDTTRPSNAPSGNDGIRDQQLALEWVKHNIELFGGRASNVTIFGESAGSMSTCLQMVSPTSRHLGKRFIMESAVCVGGLPLSSKAEADALGVRLGEALCAGNSDVVGCLRAMSAAGIVAWGSDIGIAGPGWSPVYNPGDPLMPAKPIELIAAGNYNKGEIIAGTNKNEWGLFMAGPIQSAAEYAATIDAQFGPIAPLVKTHYVVTSDAEANDVYIRLMTDTMFRCPTRALVRMVTAQGSKAYLYSFEEGLAFHAFEMGYVWGPQLNWVPPFVESLYTTMQSYWTRFAAKGNPNVGDQPVWPVYQSVTDQHMILKATSEAGSALSKADCDFWDSLGN